MPSPISPGGSSPSGGQPTMTPDAQLKAESILMEEYKHKSSLVLQTLQERTTTFNTYFVVIGIIVTGLAVAFQFARYVQDYSQIITLMIFLYLTVIHFILFERLLLLGKVCYESLLSMEMIRDVYIKRFQHQLPELERVIRARKNFNAPDSFRPNNALSCIVAALLTSSSLMAVIVVGYELVFRMNNGRLIPLPSTIFPYIFALLIGIATLAFSVLRYMRYRRSLR